MNQAMTWRAVITYRKAGRLRYLSHLDVTRAIERALRRAALPVAYTQGYNQRMRLSFGPPLPVGAEGEREIVVVTLTTKLAGAEIQDSLAAQLPPDLGVRSVIVEPAAGPTVLNLIRTAHWRVQLAAEPPPSCKELADAVAGAISSQHLEIRDGNRGKITDVRERIVHLHVESTATGAELFAVLGAGADNYLSPERLLAALGSLLEPPRPLRWTRLVRVGFGTDDAPQSSTRDRSA